MSPYPIASFTDQSGRSSRQGVALVVTLAMIAIASIMLVTFVNMMRLDRSATFTYSQSIKAEQIGMGGLTLIITQLQGEMAKDALPDTSVGALKPVYTNVTSANILPQSVGTNSAIPILFKISTNAPFFSGSLTQGRLRSTTVSSTTASVNGRSISLSRWGKAYLGTFPANGTAPYWIMMTRGGATNAAGLAFGQTTANAVNNPSLSNTNYIMGRFAYAIYDEGGLLDVTTAGYPTSLNLAQIQALKGTLAGADLSAVNVTASDLVAWRNALTAQSASTYTSYVTNFLSTNSAGRVYPGDTTFLSRQDLIKAAQNGVAGITTSSLTNLTTFTREKNSPSWSPTYNASDLGGNNGSGNIYAYKTQALSSMATNRLTALVRFPATTPASTSLTTYHDDGSIMTYTVNPGDSLIRRRFSLARLNWVGANGPQNGGTDANIQACFGLKWMTSNDALSNGAHVWQYVGPSGSTPQSSIETLDQVAAETREPNFFELLQAGILTGSLAVDGGTNTTFPNTAQRFSMFQILRIGASIIDQYDADSYPTVIEYNQSGSPWQACGVESLPYVNLLKVVSGSDPSNPSIANSTGALAIYYLIGLWNPNQATTIGTVPDVRVRLKGSVAMLCSWATGLNPGTPYGWLNGPTAYGIGYTKTLNAVLPLANAASVGSRGFSTPGLITANDISTPVTDPGPSGSNWAMTPAELSNSAGVATNRGKTYVAYRMPDLYLNANQISMPGLNWQNGSYWGAMQACFSIASNAPFACMIEFKNTENIWIPYSFSHGNNDPLTWQASGSPWETRFSVVPTAGTVPPLSDTYSKGPLYMTNDPRSIRFGFWQYTRNFTTTPPERAPDVLTSALWPSEAEVATSPYKTTFLSYGYGGGNPAPADAGNVPPIFGTSYYPAQLCRNNTANTSPTSSYQDLDKIRRIGDSGRYTSGYTTGNPFQNVADRPVILNRPFLSVGELGYVFRDNPWRSLDLFSANSADSGLLDFFSVREEATTVISGRVNLNSRNPAVLAAIVKGITSDVMNNTQLSANASSIATSLVAYTATTPLVNKSQLAAFGATLASGNFSGTTEENIKPQREAFIRALASVGQTRTWNLLIDLVAQSGKITPNATSLDQFAVDGERRYWLHLAIDRFTGEVIDKKLEVVTQ